MMLYGYAVSMPVVGAYKYSGGSAAGAGRETFSLLPVDSPAGIVLHPDYLDFADNFGSAGNFHGQPAADYLTILTVILLCRHLFADLMKG